MEKIKLNVAKCSGCGENHDNLIFDLLPNPAEIDNEFYEYVAPCPTKGMRVWAHVIVEPVITISDKISEIYDGQLQ